MAFGRHSHTLFPLLVLASCLFTGTASRVELCARFLAKGHWQVARRVGSRVVDQVALEPRFSTPTLVFLCPRSLTPPKLILEAHDA